MSLAKVVLWTYKKNKAGESKIYIRVTENRKSRLIYTQLESREEDWDFETSKFRVKYRRAEDIDKANRHLLNNEIIEKKLRETEALIKGLILDDKFVSSEQIKVEISRSSNVGKTSVLGFIDRISEDYIAIGKIGTSDCYKALKSSLITYLEKSNKTDISFNEININFLTKYEDDFRKRGAMDTGISFYIRTLRAVFNKAIAQGIIRRNLYPFDQYKISHFNTVTSKRALQKDEIIALSNLCLDSKSREFHSLNYFLFSYYNRGINFSDIAMLKWSNIQGNRLTYIRLKTNKSYTMELLDPAVKMLEYYRTNFARTDDNYIFPILDIVTHATPVSIKNRIHKVLGQTNIDLKTMGEKAKLDIPLTTYVARHTFATVMKRSVASISIIKESLGHDNERTTEIYLDSFGNDVIDDACKALL